MPGPKLCLLASLALLALLWYLAQPVVVVRVVGTSMEPTLREGDWVVAVRREIYSALDPDLTGEIVAFEVLMPLGLDREGEATMFWGYVGHRVVWFNGTHVVTRGDALAHPDFCGAPFPVGAVEYVVVRVIPREHWEHWAHRWAHR